LIYAEENFVNKIDLAKILNYIANYNPWIKTDDLWNERFIHYNLIEDLDVQRLIENIYLKVADIIHSNTKNKVQIETCQLVRWRKGDKLDPPHADCENLDGSPHPYPNRHYSALVYLNDEYEGGQIFFPHQQLEPKMSPGTLVQFEGTREFLHGVREITDGERYTVVMFFTRTDD
jgi:hypothetical protein